MEFTREQALAALERCLESQERMADQIDAPNLGDLYRSLMVRDDINMLREFAARLREDEKVERVKVPDPVFVHGLLLVQNEDGWWLHHPNGNDYNGPFASEPDASGAARLLAARPREGGRDANQTTDWSVTDRIEFALRDAGFGLDEASVMTEAAEAALAAMRAQG